MKKYLFQPASSLAATTVTTEKRHIPTDYEKSHRTTRPLTRLELYGL